MRVLGLGFRVPYIIQPCPEPIVLEALLTSSAGLVRCVYGDDNGVSRILSRLANHVRGASKHL